MLADLNRTVKLSTRTFGQLRFEVERILYLYSPCSTACAGLQHDFASCRRVALALRRYGKGCALRGGLMRDRRLDRWSYRVLLPT